jgi:hypothetical protein
MGCNEDTSSTSAEVGGMVGTGGENRETTLEGAGQGE